MESCWTLPKLPDGSIPTTEAVFYAAASQPFIEKDGEFIFDRESFLEKVLDLAEVEGHG